jgi:adenosylcobinamide kinase/adenosylcobinamide-phosphate guanylyltransferase
MSGKLTLALGGIRSGKSAFAEELAGRSGDPVLYVATGQASDGEMAERIQRHQERRPAHWHTLEEPLHLPEALQRFMDERPSVGVVLVDSIDIWVSNLLLAREEDGPAPVEGFALESLESIVSLCRQREVQGVLVSSEVGLSPVLPNRLGRRFQDLLGTVNQRAAALADEVYLVVAGIPVRIKPE